MNIFPTCISVLPACLAPVENLELELWRVVSYHVDARNQTQVLRQECHMLSTSEPSFQSLTLSPSNFCHFGCNYFKYTKTIHLFLLI